MKAREFKRWIVRSLAAALLLPAVVAVVLGLSGLLAALGDEAAARVCGRVGLALGMLWILALMATSVTTAIAVIAAPPRRRRRRRADRRPGRTAHEGPAGP